MFRLGFNPAELIFVVDVTEDNNFDITVKFLYNIVRIFKLGTVRISFVSFGRRPRLRFISKPMRKIRQIQNILTRIKARSDKKTNVGKALEFVRTRVTSRMKTNIPKVVVLITQGGSDDNVVSPSRKLKGSGVIVVSVGMFATLLAFEPNFTLKDTNSMRFKFALLKKNDIFYLI